MPKSPEEDRPREVFLSVRCLPEEKTDAEQMAAEDGISTSRYVRHLIHNDKLVRRGHQQREQAS